MSRNVSKERRMTYYVGAGLGVLGLILFGLAFLNGALNLGNFDHFAERQRNMMVMAFSGIVLLIVGGAVQRVGARGLAGSGLALDPERARRDLEPYSRMTGGLVKDALEEADINLGSRSEKVVMVRCRTCQKLNEEESKFCQECGQPM